MLKMFPQRIRGSACLSGVRERLHTTCCCDPVYFAGPGGPVENAKRRSRANSFGIAGMAIALIATIGLAAPATSAGLLLLRW